MVIAPKIESAIAPHLTGGIANATGSSAFVAIETLRMMTERDVRRMRHAALRLDAPTVRGDRRAGYDKLPGAIDRRRSVDARIGRSTSRARTMPVPASKAPGSSTETPTKRNAKAAADRR